MSLEWCLLRNDLSQSPTSAAWCWTCPQMSHRDPCLFVLGLTGCPHQPLERFLPQTLHPDHCTPEMGPCFGLVISVLLLVNNPALKDQPEAKLQHWGGYTPIPSLLSSKTAWIRGCLCRNKIIFFLVLWAATGDTFLSFASRGGRALSSSLRGKAQPSTAAAEVMPGWVSVPWVSLGFRVGKWIKNLFLYFLSRLCVLGGDMARTRFVLSSWMGSGCSAASYANLSTFLVFLVPLSSGEDFTTHKLSLCLFIFWFLEIVLSSIHSTLQMSNPNNRLRSQALFIDLHQSLLMF